MGNDVRPETSLEMNSSRGPLSRLARGRAGLALSGAVAPVGVARALADALDAPFLVHVRGRRRLIFAGSGAGGCLAAGQVVLGLVGSICHGVCLRRGLLQRPCRQLLRCFALRWWRRSASSMEWDSRVSASSLALFASS